MRVVSWVFVLCSMLGAVGVFLPSIELQLAGQSVAKRTEFSLRAVAADRQLARRLLAVYHRSPTRRTGAEILRAVTPRIHGRARAHLEDARDALDTLDDVSDDDLRTAGIIVTATVWTLLALDAAMAALLLVELTRGSYRRGRLALALVIAILVTLIAVAVHIACRQAVWEANDEIGHAVLFLGPGAYVIPVSAIAGLVAALAVLRLRRSAVTAMKRNSPQEFPAR